MIHVVNCSLNLWTILENGQAKVFLVRECAYEKESQDVITKYLGVEPILINSALMSAQNRNRLYWTNIPNVTQPQDKGIVLADILEDLPFDEAPNYLKYMVWQSARRSSQVC